MRALLPCDGTCLVLRPLRHNRSLCSAAAQSAAACSPVHAAELEIGVRLKEFEERDDLSIRDAEFQDVGLQLGLQSADERAVPQREAFRNGRQRFEPEQHVRYLLPKSGGAGVGEPSLEDSPGPRISRHGVEKIPLRQDREHPLHADGVGTAVVTRLERAASDPAVGENDRRELEIVAKELEPRSQQGDFSWLDEEAADGRNGHGADAVMPERVQRGAIGGKSQRLAQPPVAAVWMPTDRRASEAGGQEPRPIDPKGIHHRQELIERFALQGVEPRVMPGRDRSVDPGDRPAEHRHVKDARVVGIDGLVDAEAPIDTVQRRRRVRQSVPGGPVPRKIEGVVELGARDWREFAQHARGGGAMEGVERAPKPPKGG